MSRNKHLYQVTLIHLERNVYLPDEVQIWANNKRQLYQICEERYPEQIVFYARYIK